MSYHATSVAVINGEGTELQTVPFWKVHELSAVMKRKSRTRKRSKKKTGKQNSGYSRALAERKVEAGR